MAFLPVLSSPACSGFPGSCEFSSHIWFTPFAMGSPLWGRGWFVLDRNEGSCVFLSLLGLFLHVVTALGVWVTIWVSVVGRFLLMCDRRFSWVLRTFSWMSYEPLSVAPLCARLLWGGFLVVLAEDESLRLSLALSSVLPCNMFWLHVCLHGTGSGP